MGKVLPRLAVPRRGEVHLVRFDPTIGAEIRKTRPALVIQDDIYNRHGSTTIVAPITSRKDREVYPTEVVIAEGEGGLVVESLVLCGQVRCVDRARLAKRLGRIKPETLARVEQALLLRLGVLEV